ncbi:unnamed protein product [Mycena citricolor]|uniref:Large ribosomal subunit protein bL28c n=1 Tax=Mycena citricolor TaxID=2018698 RepID=A0AAD2HQX1_9AGAR|nr:unnamed protein product [Mycena citricolor]
MRPSLVVRGARAVSDAIVTSQPFKRAQFGLFQGKTKQYGNNVPFSLRKTRRTWLPNVQRKRLFSESMQDFVRVKLTTAALKTKGGIDNYVIQTGSETLGFKGMQIRQRVRDAQARNAESEAAAQASTSKPAPTPSRAATFDPMESRRSALKFVRHTRRLAAKALGLTGFASAKDTINYMKEQKLKQDRLLPRRTPQVIPV